MSTDGDVIQFPRPLATDDEEPQIVDAHLLPEPQGPERQPIIPPQYQRENRRTTFDAWRELTWYRFRYHGIRLLPYLWWSSFWATIGVFKFIRATHRWWMLAESRPLIQSAILRDDPKEFEVQKKHQEDVSKRRGLEILAILIGGLIVIGAAAWYLAPWVPFAVGLLVGYPCFAHYGHPKDKPIISRAVVPVQVEPLTSGQIIDALASLGIAGINQALAKDPAHAIRFTGEIHRDGPGWRADFILPPGVTATQIIENRDRFASGLGRPLGAVWPEGNVEISPGAVILWVGYEDMAKAQQPPWPLLRSGQVDLFKPIPFGTDQRGRRVKVDLIYADILIGAIKDAGKSNALRGVLLAASLDPRAEIWTYELKGTGDLEALGQVASRYASGAGDDVIEEALNALRELNEERTRRARELQKLPRDLRPDYKITDHLASVRHYRLHPLIIAIDECQQLFAHKRFGAEAGELAEQLIRLGRAVGIIPLLATQRPDRDAVPTGVSANAGTRFCLRVMGQVENDMVLGTSMYKAGIRATMFTQRDRGIGYLVGQGDPKIVRTYYIDGPAAERVALRARAIREKAGRLNGYALLGEDGERQSRIRSLLDDINAVIQPGEDKVWSVTILSRLAELRPGVYERWTQKTLGTELRNTYRIDTKPISVRDGADVTTNYGVHVEDVRAVLETRRIGG